MKRPEWIPAILTIAVVVFFAAISPDFRDFRYLLSNTSLYAETGLLAIGMTLIIISGNIDLSVGSSVVLTACLVAKFSSEGTPLPVSVLFALIIGTLLGTISGLLITLAKLPSFLVTLATMALYRGAAEAIMGPASAKVPHALKGIDRPDLFGLPYPLLIFLVVLAIVGIVLHRMILGRWLFGIGTNAEAARYTGFPVNKATISAFAITGLLVGIAALILDSRLGVARNDLAKGYELEAITIVVAGGTAISGGKGTMLGTLLSWLLLYFTKTGMGVNNVKPEYQLTIVGLILVLSVFAQNVAASFSNTRQPKPTKIQTG
ncbi:MAG: ABC transporter permease [Armatimonadetes bacterium]|nr:ABC transporter permease [Armatimonadota bacterium]